MIERTLLTAFFVIAAAVSAAAQDPPPEPTPAPEIVACDAEFASFLVSQQVEESRSVTDVPKRIRILVRSADFLWKPDQKTARSYYEDAFKAATAHFKEKGFEKDKSNTFMTLKPDLRFEVIRSIATKDGEWAKRLTDQILKEYEKEASNRSEADKTREISDTLRIATMSVKTNPDLSWYLFRRVMNEPLDNHWYHTVYTVAGQDRDMADRLYSELLSKYANESPRRLLFLSSYPFVSERIFGIDKFQYGAARPETLTPNPSLQHAFVDMFLTRVTSYSQDPANLNLPAQSHYSPEPLYMISALSEMEPLIVRDMPHFLQRLGVAKAQAQAMMNEEMKKKLGEKEDNLESLSRGFDRKLELLEEAEKDGKLTDYMIVSLVTWGNENKTEEQYKKIEPWLDKIKNAKTQEQVKNHFWFLRSKLAIKDLRFDDAQKFALKVPELDHRAVLSLEIADAQLKDVNEAAAFYQTLGEVSRLVRQSGNSVEKVRVLLGMANIYHKVNRVYAMNELSDAVKVINSLKNPDLSSQYVMRQIIGDKFASYASYPLPGSNMEETFRALSKEDFDLPLSNARSIDDKFLRTIAVLAIAKNCVDRPKKLKKEEQAK